MDFVDWCDRILQELVEQSRFSTAERTVGTHYRELGTRLSAEGQLHQDDVYHALCELRRNGLVEDQHGHFWKATALGRQLASDTMPLWQAICQQLLEPEHEQVVRVINRLSVSRSGEGVSVTWVDGDTIAAELAWPDPTLLHAVARELEQRGFVGASGAIGRLPRLHATYQGLVWETRRGFTVESAFIDSLVAEWETTSVDFKRQLDTDTADQKAELVKDALGLANTQASGRRWMIIGFDNKTRSYWGSPNPKLSQDHLEQLFSRYTEPMVQVRYKVVDYRMGLVGVLEVLREPAKLPYRVARSIGKNKRIERAQVFVRHGSQTEQPTPREFSALQAEAEREQSI